MTPAPMRYDGAPERRKRLLAFLNEEGSLSLTELATRLGVSDMTVRRDLDRLKQTGDVRIVHGGASLPHSTFRSSFVARAGASAQEKKRIAQKATEAVPPRGTIAVDAGTTAYEVAAALPDDFNGAIVTHSIPVIQLMLGRPKIRVVGLGGDLLPESHAFVGPMTVEAAKRLRVGAFFLGAAAIDSRGVYVETDAERPTKTALMDIADEVVLLADHTKLTASAPVLLCPLERITRLVTDRQPPTRLEGCEVIVADAAEDTD